MQPELQHISEKRREMSFTKNKDGSISKAVTAAKKCAQKWGAQTGLVFLCALSVLAAFLGLTVAVERLAAPHAYNFGMAVLGITICTMLYYGCLSEEKSADKSIPLFMRMLLFDALLSFLDSAAYVTNGIAEMRTLNLANLLLYYLFANFLIYQLWRYIRVYLPMEGTLARCCDRVMLAAMVLQNLCVFANLFVPLYFYVDEQGFFCRTEFNMFAECYIFVLLICATLYLLRVKAPLRDKIVLSMYFILPVASISVYLFIDTHGAYLPDTPLLSITLMYVVLVGARSKKLASTSAELDMATRIQANMLPNLFPAFPKYEEFDIYATMTPAKEVGGDFYDFFLIDSDRLAMVVADVSGKGVPAALFMMTARTILKTKAQSNPSLSPKELLEEANAALTENNEEDMFVTVWFGELQISTGELTYSDAGHEKLLLYQDGEWKFLPTSGGVALAMWEPEDLEFMDEQYRFRNQTIHLNPGDAIFQYTDGVTEATDAHNELFGDDRLLSAMNSAPASQPEELLPYVRTKIDEFVKDAPQFDDITMLGLRYKG